MHAAFLCACCAMLGPQTLRAADFVVTDTGDSGVATLRQAIDDANASADPSSTITFSLPDSSTITLLSSLPLISTLLTIDGATAVDLTIRGSGLNPIFRLAATTAVNDIDLENGPLEVGQGTFLQLGLTRDGSFDGVIGDAGALEKLGPARLTLLGANTYSGGTIISEGTLEGDTASLQGDITNNGNLVFTLVGLNVFPGAITGTGTLTLSSGGLHLTGANTYTGLTTLAAGTGLRTATQSLPGDVSLASGSLLTFTDNVDGTYDGNISGDGSVSVTQSGTLTLTGTNSYTGGTLHASGTLIGDTDSLPGDIMNFATLIFDQQFDGTFSGVISDLAAFGAPSLEKRGDGTLTFSAAHTYTSLTTISAGQLNVDGAIVGGVQVDAGATLGGTGSILGGATIDGTVSPGLATGQDLDFDSITFNPGSTLVVGVNESGMADRVDVSGVATIVDTTAVVVVEPAPGAYLTPVVVPILSAGSLSGSFDAITLPTFAFLDTSLATVGETIELTIVSNGQTFFGFAQTDNQRAVGAMLDQPPSGVDDVLGILNLLSSSAIPAALDAIGGEQLGQFPTTEIAIASRLDRAIQARIRGLVWRGSGRSPLSLDPGWDTLPMAGRGPALGMTERAVGAAANEEPGRLGAWLDGYGLLGDVEGDGNTDDLDYTIYGGTLGIDYRVGQHLLVGVAGGYAASDLDYDSRSGSFEVDTYQGAVYVGYTRPGYYLGASARYAFSEYETIREISFPGLDRTASGEFDGATFGGHLEAGMDGFGIGRLLVQPIASLSYTHISQDGYTESGAGSLNLRVDNDDVDSLMSGLGARLYGRFYMGEGMWTTPELRVRWTHEFGDDDRRIHARLDEATVGGAFVIDSAEIGSDSLLIGAAWTVTTRDRLQVFVEYDTILNEDLIEHSFSAGVRIIW